MSGEIIKEFLVGIGIEVDKAGVSSFNKEMAMVATVAAGVVVAIQTAAAGLFFFTKDIAEQADDLGDLADRINSTAGAVQEFGYVAQLSGSSIEVATSSLEALNKNAGDTALGIGRAKKIFEQLNISVKDSNGKLKNTTDLVWEIGDAIKDMDSGKQSAILQRLGLDRTLVNTLTTDVSGLRKEFNELFNQDEINKASEDAGVFMDTYDRMRIVVGGIMKKIAANFFKPFTENMVKLTKVIAEYAPKIIDFFTPILNVILRVATAMITLFVRVFSIVYSAISTFLGWLNTINEAFDGWPAKIALAILAWKLLSATILASPIGILLSLGAAVLALIDDFMTWKEGGDSLFDWSAWSPWFDAIMNGIHLLNESLKIFFDTLFATFGLAKSLLGMDWDMAKFHAGNILENVGKVGNGITGALGVDLSPTPSAQAGLTPSTNVNQKTEINVNGAGDPKAVANQVLNGQNRTNDDMVRNMKSRAR